MTNITFVDQLLPNQPLLKKYFEGEEKKYFANLYDMVSTSCNIRKPTNEFNLKESPTVSTELMASSPILLRFLETMVYLKKPRSILEVGTFIGLSAMYIAKAMHTTGRLITIEKFEHFADIALNNFKANKIEDKIQLIQGDAFEVLEHLSEAEPFDMIFLDANKERYSEYFDILDNLLNPDGLLIVDDVLFHGDVLNEKPVTEKGVGVRRFLDKVENIDSYHKVLLPIANGIMLMIKK